MLAFGQLTLTLWVSETAGSVFIVQETNVKTVLFQTESHEFLFQAESHFYVVV